VEGPTIARTLEWLGRLTVAGVFLRVQSGRVIINTVICAVLMAALVWGLRRAAPTLPIRRCLDGALVALVVIGVCALRAEPLEDGAGTAALLSSLALNLGMAAFARAMAGWSDALGTTDSAHRYRRGATTMLLAAGLLTAGALPLLAFGRPRDTGSGSSSAWAFGRSVEGPLPWLVFGGWIVLTIVGDLRMSGGSASLRKVLHRDGGATPPTRDPVIGPAG
jgi:hypothetical protein